LKFELLMRVVNVRVWRDHGCWRVKTVACGKPVVYWTVSLGRALRFGFKWLR
jgi:hypothetical protein